MKPYSDKELEEIKLEFLNDIRDNIQNYYSNYSISFGQSLVCVQLDTIARLLVSIHLKLNEGE